MIVIITTVCPILIVLFILYRVSRKSKNKNKENIMNIKKDINDNIRKTIPIDPYYLNGDYKITYLDDIVIVEDDDSETVITRGWDITYIKDKTDNITEEEFLAKKNIENGGRNLFKK